MITPTVFYQQMKKWVSTDEARPVFQHIYFDGERAVATNVHRMVVVKNHPSDAHFETTMGARADKTEKWTFPTFDRAIPPLDKALWMHEIEFPVFTFKDFITQWKNGFDSVKKVAKSTKYNCFALQKLGGKLYARAINGSISMTISLLNIEKPSSKNEDWFAGFNINYIIDAIDFLKATEPRELRMYVNGGHVLVIETEELLMVITPVNLKSSQDGGMLSKFVETETEKERLWTEKLKADNDDDEDIF